jgi:adenylate cyclase
MTTNWNLRMLRNNLRLVSALVLLAFVICHLTAHSLLLVSFERAGVALDLLMYPWRTTIGTTILISALLAHYSNALWSIYVRRYLRLSRWEWWQLGIGLCIPPLLMLHVTSTRIAESLLGVTSRYSSVLIVQWQLSPWLAVLQTTAVLTVWIHAFVGVHFWLRTKEWYAHWRRCLSAWASCCRPLALCGYITAGNQVLRNAENSNYARLSLEPHGRETGRNSPHRADRIGHLPSPGATTLCRARRAWLAPSPSAASTSDSLERTNRTHTAGSNGA